MIIYTDFFNIICKLLFRSWKSKWSTVVALALINCDTARATALLNLLFQDGDKSLHTKINGTCQKGLVTFDMCNVIRVPYLLLR